MDELGSGQFVQQVDDLSRVLGLASERHEVFVLGNPSDPAQQIKMLVGTLLGPNDGKEYLDRFCIQRVEVHPFLVDADDGSDLVGRTHFDVWDSYSLATSGTTRLSLEQSLMQLIDLAIQRRVEIYDGVGEGKEDVGGIAFVQVEKDRVRPKEIRVTHQVLGVVTGRV